MSIATSPQVGQNHVPLLRFGEGGQRFDLAAGATLADLLREAGSDPAGCQVMIDGRRPIEEAVLLRPGMIVSLSPKAAALDPEPWRLTVGMFKDDLGFEQLMEDVMAALAAEKP